MKEATPDFYMTSTESRVLMALRRCYRLKRFPAKERDDYLLIRISPALDIRQYEIPGSPISQLIVGTHFAGESLFPVKKWPVSVYVLRLLVADPEDRDVLDDGELELLDWAELYDSEQSALNAMR